MVAPMAIAALASMGGQLGMNIANAVNPPKPSQGQKEAFKTAATSRRMIQAGTDPSDPWNKNLTGALEQQLQQDAARSVMEDLMRRRRMVAAGNVPVGVASNRRDEATQGALARSFQDAGINAQQVANRQLLAGGHAMQGLVPQYSGLGQQQDASNAAIQQNRQNLAASGPFSIAHMYELMSGMFGGGGNVNNTAIADSPYNKYDRMAYSGSLSG